MDIKQNQFYPLFEAQRKNQYTVGNTSAKARIRKLNALKRAVECTYRDQIRKALYEDFKKPPTETDLTEVYQIIGEIKFVRSRLQSWMRKQAVETPM
ncbi:MAG: aldehyde dehydrogenase family protein, partial [Eudoraea sp.]|nr:aldehyde dehydrogenase family protein [Eudoraea sp.]